MRKSKFAAEILARAKEHGEVTLYGILDIGHLRHLQRLMVRMSKPGDNQSLHVIRYLRRSGRPTPVYAFGPGENAPKPKSLTSSERNARYKEGLATRGDARSARRREFIRLVEEFAADDKRFVADDIVTPESKKYTSRLLNEMVSMRKLCRVAYRRRDAGGCPVVVYQKAVKGRFNILPPTPFDYSTRARRWRKRNPDKVKKYNEVRRLPPDAKAKRAAERAARKNEERQKKVKALVEKSIERVKADPLAGFLYGGPKKINTNF